MMMRGDGLCRILSCRHLLLLVVHNTLSWCVCSVWSPYKYSLREKNPAVSEMRDFHSVLPS